MKIYKRPLIEDWIDIMLLGLMILSFLIAGGGVYMMVII
jgi:hypothetical protein